MASLLLIRVVRMSMTWCTLGSIVLTMLTKIKVLQNGALQTLVLPLFFEKKPSLLVLISPQLGAFKC